MPNKNKKPELLKDLLDSLPPSIWVSQIDIDGRSVYRTYSVSVHGFGALKGINDMDPKAITRFTSAEEPLLSLTLLYTCCQCELTLALVQIMV